MGNLEVGSGNKKVGLGGKKRREFGVLTLWSSLLAPLFYLVFPPSVNGNGREMGGGPGLEAQLRTKGLAESQQIWLLRALGQEMDRRFKDAEAT